MCFETTSIPQDYGKEGCEKIIAIIITEMTQ